ncbi:dihydrolipoamide acetyltransferase family protein [Pseudofrankia sp. BMG5.37]|uniref:dihydrolipoamide acetyltransferase family protein n=1 Tax=Pseudofrankia sp. BMG5.37 TaxID=3050035 RepID=UPI00289576D9|nr:dihydrolipoamide acetyltransferase family protein [Pseudofrankia sp. BMG5.37]MDT3444965.1 dihydrolipoamide acetyltransferase family protein [Pseudofrankia sp. BMG5.37]
MARREFRLPDLGEGLAEAEIVRWLVAVGDTVTVNQPLAEVETAKALVELPSPFAGRLVATHGAEGETIFVGAVLVTIEDDEPTDADGGGPLAQAPAAVPVDEPAGGGPAEAAGPPVSGLEVPDVPVRRGGGREPVLVGYGPRTSAGAAGLGRARRRRQRAAAPTEPTPPAAASQATAPPAPLNAFAAGAASTSVGTRTPAAPPGGGGADGGRPADEAAAGRGGRALAKPPVRKLARDLGVDLGLLSGTGPAGSISRADVETAARALVTGAPEGMTRPAEPDAWAPPAPPTREPASQPAASATGRAGAGQVGRIPAEATFDAASRIWRVPVSGVRRATARAMVSSAFTAPHVTEFVTADLTETMATRDRFAALPEFAGVKVTPLLFAARALLVAVRRHPMINTSWVERERRDPEIAVSEAVNLGIAVASPRGLLVPNISDADRLDMAGLAHALADLTARTRAGQARPADLTGGTITITNIGVFGVDTGTPVLNPGEAAILALGAVRPAPWVHEGQLAVRTVGQLALSFDHRLVDGELGSAVLADVAAMLTDPALLLAWS